MNRRQHEQGASASEALGASQRELDACDDDAIVIARPSARWLAELAAEIDDRPPEEVPLRGTTFTIKDNIDLEGVVTTVGCPSIGYRPPTSAAIVRHLVAAGAVPVAKVNLDQFATGLVGTRSPYGTPRNPYDATLVPGGSSSGSATSVAKGLATFSVGTDTAGSGRVPAALCGVASVKPTPGRVSSAGIVPAVRSIDCPAVFARDLHTAWRAVELSSGVDRDDPYSLRSPGVAGRQVRRLGVIPHDGLRGEGVDARVLAEQVLAWELLEQRGFELVEIDVEPLFEIGDLLYGGPFISERAAAVAALAPPPDSVDPVVAEVLASAMSYSLDSLHRANYRVQSLRHVIDEMFERVDAIAVPTIGWYPSLADVARAPIAVNARLGRFTTFTNLARLCAVTVPVPVVDGDPRRPPPSITVQGPAWSDEHVVDAALSVLGEVAPHPPSGWLPLVVVGAHLRGEVLEHQLVQLGAIWVETTRTAPTYRLYAMTTDPPKPALVHDSVAGATVEVDVWALSPAALGSFVASIPPPLAIGTVDLADGRCLTGFVAEPRARDGAIEITDLGGWRSYRSATRHLVPGSE